MQTQTEKQQPVGKFSLGRSCTKCGHIHICAVYRAIAPLLQSWTDETKPFEAQDLATVCKQYVSSSVIDIINQ